jgi:hypothetical protein
MEADSNHRFVKSNSPDFSVGFDRRRRRVEMPGGRRYFFTQD